LTTIGEYAFYKCGGLNFTTIPHGVTSIGEYAFQYGSALREITFEGTPISIGSGVFSNTGIQTINVPWAEGAVANAPWGASKATINYNYRGS
jgi:hypothetical protein